MSWKRILTMILSWTEMIGFVAAGCTTFAFVPQLVKIRRQGGRDLSYVMLTIYLAGLFLWLVYGLRLHAPAIIAANVVAIVLVSAAIMLKFRMERLRLAQSETAEGEEIVNAADRAR